MNRAIFAAAAVAALSLASQSAVAKPAPGGSALGAAAAANQQTAAAPQNGGAASNVGAFDAELANGTLSQADYDTLKNLAVTEESRLSEKWGRSISRGMLSKASLDEALSNMTQSAETLSSAISAKSASGAADASITVTRQMVNRTAIPANTELGLIINDYLELYRTLYQARAKMPGANAASIQRTLNQLDTVQRQAETKLRNDRVSLERADTALADLTPAQKAVLTQRMQQAMDRGDLTVGPDGSITMRPPPETKTSQPDATGTSTGSAGPDASSPDDGAATSDQSASGDVQATTTTSRPVHRGTIPSDAPDPAVSIPQSVQDAYSAQQTSDYYGQMGEAFGSVFGQAAQTRDPLRPVELKEVPITGDRGRGVYQGAVPPWPTPLPGIQRIVDGELTMEGAATDDFALEQALANLPAAGANFPDSPGLAGDQGGYLHSDGGDGMGGQVSFASIYRNYVVVLGQGGSSLMLVPSTEIATPSSVMTSLDLQPALCGR
jgi:hypothetical protein